MYCQKQSIHNAKDHKTNIRTSTPGRLLNQYQSALDKISKLILEKTKKYLPKKRTSIKPMEKLRYIYKLFQFN